MDYERINEILNSRIDDGLRAVCLLQLEHNENPMSNVMLQAKAFEYLCRVFHKHVSDLSIDMEEIFSKVSKEYFEFMHNHIEFKEGTDFTFGFFLGAIWANAHCEKVIDSATIEASGIKQEVK